MKTTHALVALSFGAALFGCAATTDSSGSEVGSKDDEPTFTETSVRFDAEGTAVVVSRTVTLTEESKQVAARLSPVGAGLADKNSNVGTTSEALTKDAGCLTSSFWLYDKLNRTGNKICFSGTGVAHLADYKDCSPGQDPATCPTWAQNVGNHSYWAGNKSGHFQDRYPNCVNPSGYHCPDFKALQKSDFLTFCEAIKPDINISDALCISPTASTDFQSPMTASGSNFSPGGSVKFQVLRSDGTPLFSDTFQSADGTGHVSKLIGNGYKGGIPCQGNNCGSCGETVKLTDVTSGVSVTTPSHACFEPGKS